MILSEDGRIDELMVIIEESTRSSEEGVKRFIEPAIGTLRSATSKRHHIIFGRRGSGKSSLLRKAAADLTIDRRPIAFIDLEKFKGHSYPDVLLSVLIDTLKEYKNWLSTAAIHPATKTSFWKKLFGSTPQRSAYNRNESIALADEIEKQIKELERVLYAVDNQDVNLKTHKSREKSDANELSGGVGTEEAGVKGRKAMTSNANISEERHVSFKDDKTDFLHRHIMDYQNLIQNGV